MACGVYEGSTGDADSLRAWLRLLQTPQGEDWLASPKGVRWSATNAVDGVPALVLAHGIAFEPVPWSAWASQYEQGPPGECYRTAWRLVESESSFHYCEGFAWQGSYGLLPVAHGWAVGEGGRVIDPTWTEHPTYPVEGWQYLGIPFAAEFVCRQHDAYGCYSILPQLACAELAPEAIALPWRSP